MDKKLTEIKEYYWQGKDLPFPVLLDATGKTEELYGISAHPTGLLIDPDGKLVGEASVADLEAKLPPLPTGKKWARHRDMQKNRFWSFEPSVTTLNVIVETLKRETGCDVELDAAAVKTSGLTPGGPLAGVVYGGPITLRSIVELLLGPHGLGVVPSLDEKKLLISTRPLPAEAESHLQKLRVRELTDRLDRASVTGRQAEAKPLEIKNQSLLDVVKQVGREFDLPMALDARAMHVNALDVNAKTSGCIVPGDLRNSLTKMLHPLGLTIEVRQEVVCVTPLRLFEHARKWLGPSVATVVLVASVSAWLLIRTRRPSAKS